MKINRNSEITYTPEYLTVDGTPWFPIMGEIHYSRVRSQDWEEELLKMKAGGVDIVSAYTIWIHHEEIEGQFDFTGCRDLHAFMETVKRCGLHCILRIGPWAHGEVRNGGFPDWLVQLEKEGKARLRTDDPVYLDYVRRFYAQIFAQVKGLLLSDDGPILGIQIENEYGHVGGQTGEAGEQHMRTLRRLAEEAGFLVPLYTATGWGGAVTGGMLPVMGGYAEAPWDQRLTEIEPSGNYVFTKERNDHGIGSDHGIGEGVTFSYADFPYLTAELGGGLQVTRHRRCVASGRDIQAMTLAKLGSGVNLLGYYMYHGGTNPEGKLSTLQESRETGYPNDLPVKSYDFNAPIKEYGQLSDTFRRIKVYAMMIHDFGEEFCRTQYIPQPGNPETPADLQSLRSAVRYDHETDQGYYFVNNYQRRYPMAEHRNERLCARDEGGRVLEDFGAVDVQDGDYFFWPFHLKLGKAVLKQAKATPLCILHGSDGQKNTYVFWTKEGTDPSYELEGDCSGIRILTLTEEQALHAMKVNLHGTETLLIAPEGDLMQAADGQLTLRVCVRVLCYPVILAYPAPGSVPEGYRYAAPLAMEDALIIDSNSLAAFTAAQKVWNPVIRRVEKEGESAEAAIYRLEAAGIPAETRQVLALIDYDGFTAEMFQDGNLIADNFYTGQVWETDLKRFSSDGAAVVDFRIRALHEDTKVYLQDWPAMQDGRAMRLNDVSTECVYQLPLSL